MSFEAFVFQKFSGEGPLNPPFTCQYPDRLPQNFIQSYQWPPNLQFLNESSMSPLKTLVTDHAQNNKTKDKKRRVSFNKKQRHMNTNQYFKIHNKQNLNYCMQTELSNDGSRHNLCMVLRSEHWKYECLQT